MKLEDLVALIHLCPKEDSYTWIAWLSKCRAEGLLDEAEWVAGAKLIKQHLYAFK